MYRNVYFPGVRRRSVNKKQNDGYVHNPIVNREYPQFNEFSPEVSAAMMAYASPIIQKPYEKMSLNDNILRLKQEGKIEGVDYKIDGCEMGNLVLFINNKNGQPVKVLHYDNGDVEQVNCHEVYQYKNGREIKSSGYSRNELDNITDKYYNNEIPQWQFTKEEITAYTKPKEYIEYLKRNNVKFKIEPQIYGDGREIVGITEYDRRNRECQFTGFELSGENRVMREIYERDGSRKRLEFDENATYITEYFN